jgi:hypothetical protein
MGKYVLLWFPMVLAAILNGAAREGLYAPHTGELRAHQISTVTGIVLLGVYMWWALRVWRPDSAGQAAATGLLWVVMTLAFEFLFGHYVARHPWPRIFREYNLMAGRVWVFIPLWVAAAPPLFFRLTR